MPSGTIPRIVNGRWYPNQYGLYPGKPEFGPDDQLRCKGCGYWIHKKYGALKCHSTAEDRALKRAWCGRCETQYCSGCIDSDRHRNNCPVRTSCPERPADSLNPIIAPSLYFNRRYPAWITRICLKREVSGWNHEGSEWVARGSLPGDRWYF